MNLHVYTISTQPLDTVPLTRINRPDVMLASCIRFGVPLEVEVVASVDAGRLQRHKVTGLRNILRRLPDDDVLLYTDGWDAFFASPLGGVLQAYATFGTPVVFSAEHNLHPVVPDLKDVYPPSSTRYRYLNSGGAIGVVGALRELHDKWLREDQLAPDFDDQYHWHRAFIGERHLISLDHHCRIFQTLSSRGRRTSPMHDLHVVNGRVYNRDTDSTPYIVHGNGNRRTKLAVQLWDQLAEWEAEQCEP